MSRTLNHPRRRPTRCRPGLVALEVRLALSGSGTLDLGGVGGAALTVCAAATPATLQVVKAVPQAGVPMSQSPATVEVVFDRPLDPLSVGFDDVRIDAQQADGTWAPAFPTTAPDETLDPTGTQLQLSLGAPLPPGVYRLVLTSGTSLTGLDGSSLASTDSDVVVGGFSVGNTGATLDDATDLRTLDPSGRTLAVTGSLDLASNPSAVVLEKFTVPAGHFWRLGAQVDGQQLGSTLASALALFDASGRPLKVANVGRAATPGDAYLFAGLGPGTYYLGVSGVGNLPGAAYGGYDPTTGNPGTVAQAQAEAPFRLLLAIDTADAPAALVRSSLDYGDPLGTTPTGLTLTFNGVLDAETVRGTPTAGFVLTDQHGASYPLTVSTVDEHLGRYSFTFDDALPPGHYTLRVPTGGAKDLAGLTPVGAGGRGEMASFNVVSKGPKGDPRDLGALDERAARTLSFTDQIDAGTAVTYRFVALVPGQYHFTDGSEASSVKASLLSDSGKTAFGATVPGVLNRFDAFLKPGVYLLTFTNTGGTATRLGWTLRMDNVRDSLFDNGVGQSTALSLRLVDPNASDAGGSAVGSSGPSAPVESQGGVTDVPGVGTIADDTGQGGAAVTVLTAATAGPAPSPAPSLVVPPSTVMTAGFLANLGAGLVGRPTLDNEQVAAAGLGGSSVAMAYQGLGLPAGLTSRGGAAEEPTGAAPATVVGPESGNGALPALPAAPSRALADEMAVTAADWLNRLLATRLPAWPWASDAEAGEEAPEAIAMARDDSPVEGGSVQSASLGAPAAVGVMGLVAARHYLPRLMGPRAAPVKRRRATHLRGPHGRF